MSIAAAGAKKVLTTSVTEAQLQVFVALFNGMQRIESTQNDKFKLWRSLLESRGIKKSGLCLVSGSKIVREVAESHGDQVKAVLHYDESLLGNSIAANSSGPSFSDRKYLLSHPLFDELDILGTKSDILVLETPSLENWSESAESHVAEILLPLGDPLNLGAVIRSAVAFGFLNIVLLEEASNPFLPKTVRASSGAVFKCRLMTGPSVRELKQKTLALDMNGEDISVFRWPRNARLLVGEEGQGIPSSDNFKKLMVPMKSDIESLNAGVASGIALYEWSKHT